MKCVLCMYVREGEASDAVFVLGGYSLCEDHLEYGQTFEFSAMITAASRK